MNNEKLLDLAGGAVWGALIGDAAGAYLEFFGQQPTQSDVEEAMSMPGGGCLRIAPGQITDDGEMTIALARVLAAQKTFDVDRVAQAYRRWFLSRPFDVGNATRAALEQGNPDRADLSQLCTDNARRRNMNSKANGCLMRVTPLGVWATQFPDEVVIEAAKADSRLTHPNETCQVATAAYVIAIRHLLLYPGDRQGAFDAAVAVSRGHGQAEVLGFLENARSGDLPAYHPRPGYLGIAFTHAFHHLLLGSTYLEALREVLAGGGDSDTNACIVGGLIGALVGQKNLPIAMLTAVRNCDVNLGQVRPDWLQTRHFLGVIDRILAESP